MTIPHWPKRSARGGIPIREAIANAYNEHGESMVKASVRMRSRLYRNGDPMVCLSCGAKTTPDGDLPCGH